MLFAECHQQVKYQDVDCAVNGIGNFNPVTTVAVINKGTCLM